MMQHKGNNVFLTGTDRVKRGDATTAPCRSTNYSGKTESATASVTLSTASCQGTQTTNTSIAANEDEASEKLIRMIAEEIFNSAKKNGILSGDGDASKPSHDGRPQTSGSSLSNAAHADLSDKILNSFEAKCGGSIDRKFRKMLREGLQECESTTRVSPVRSSADSTTNSNRSGSTDSGFSGLSGLIMKHHTGYKAPMDIWHPNFWNEAAGENSADSDVFAGMGDGMARPMQSSLGDLDDDSVLSDISGVTGVFTASPEGRQSDTHIQSSSTKEKYELGTAPHSIIASKSKPKSKNPVVSFSLRFDKVVVRNYEQILSDSPACAKGPSIGLGWKFVEHDYDIEAWEMERGRLRQPSELLLKRGQREKLLRDLGYTEKDIAAAVRKGNKIRSQRRQTINNLGVSDMEEAVENASRRVKTMLFWGTKDITY
jgi:hypothetical protein